LFFTDCEIPAFRDDNIQFIDFSLEDFNKLASQKLDLRIQIQHPYKICDLRPAFGDIFAEYITDYNFWGYGDIDLIYGNLDAYFIDELLDNYDILSNHDQFVTGHLCLLRNSPKVISLYKKDELFKEIFKDPFYRGFDEQLRRHKFDPEGEHLQSRIKVHLRHHVLKASLFSLLRTMIPARLKSRLRKDKFLTIKDFTSIVRYYTESGKIRVLHLRTFQSDLMLKKICVKNWYIKWDRGRLTSSHNQEGILYFHFILSKLEKSFSVQEIMPGTDSFTVTKFGIARIPG